MLLRDDHRAEAGIEIPINVLPKRCDPFGPRFECNISEVTRKCFQINVTFSIAFLAFCTMKGFEAYCHEQKLEKHSRLIG